MVVPIKITMHTCSSFQGLVQIVIYSFTELSSTSKDWRILKLRHKHFAVSSSLVWEHWVHWHPHKCDGVNQYYDKWKKTKTVLSERRLRQFWKSGLWNQKKGVAQKLITFIVKLRLTVYKDCDKDKSKHPLLMEWVVH